jgi:hypothetical protein
VPIPWHRDGHPKTQLRQAGVAVCSWNTVVATAEIVDTKGIVPTKHMNRIMQILEALSPPS